MTVFFFSFSGVANIWKQVVNSQICTAIHEIEPLISATPPDAYEELFRHVSKALGQEAASGKMNTTVKSDDVVDITMRVHSGGVESPLDRLVKFVYCREILFSSPPPSEMELDTGEESSNSEGGGDN